MSLGTKLFTWLKGEEVGHDDFGNRYYRERNVKAGETPRRWVIYKGTPEASKVPPEWHGWLHRSTDVLPVKGGSPKYAWQKEHLPNLTGTELAYRPPGHTLMGGHRAKSTGDYEPWQPS